MAAKRVPVPGSERKPFAKATRVGKPDAGEVVEVTMAFHRHTPPSKNGQYRNREEYAVAHSLDDNLVSRVRSFASSYNLTITDIAKVKRTIRLSGRLADIESAFEVDLGIYSHKYGKYRGREGNITLPDDIAFETVAVLGLDNRPAARPHCRRRSHQEQAASASYSPRDLASLYNIPTGDGAGQCVAIIELGGGYKNQDMAAYFSSLGISAPTIVSVGVLGAQNTPGSDADQEVQLDIQVIGAIANGALIIVYFAPNTDQGFLEAINEAIHDSQHNPSVVSISWGSPESEWAGQSMTAMDQAFQAAADLHVTICASAGDDGSTDGVTDGQQHVDFPASSPHVLACGGTTVNANGGKITSETVWNESAQDEGATGGGVSSTFDLPTWQAQSRVPANGNGAKRGVPDVAGDADPTTGYQVTVNGESLVMGGTSAVSPLWSALIAIINQKRGTPAGYLNPTLYGLSSAAQAFNDITSGNNGGYQAGPGWDCCTGLGSPSGVNLLNALRNGS